MEKAKVRTLGEVGDGPSTAARVSAMAAQGPPCASCKKHWALRVLASQSAAWGPEVCTPSGTSSEMRNLGTFLVVQWLRSWASTAWGIGSIPGWGTKILHAMQHDQKQILKKRENFPGGSVVKNPPTNAGDTGLIPDLGRSHRATDPVHHNDWVRAP